MRTFQAMDFEGNLGVQEEGMGSLFRRNFHKNAILTIKKGTLEINDRLPNDRSIVEIHRPDSVVLNTNRYQKDIPNRPPVVC